MMMRSRSEPGKWTPVVPLAYKKANRTSNVIALYLPLPMSVLVSPTPSLPQASVPVASPMNEFTDMECAASSFVEFVLSVAL